MFRTATDPGWLKRGGVEACLGGGVVRRGAGLRTLGVLVCLMLGPGAGLAQEARKEAGAQAIEARGVEVEPRDDVGPLGRGRHARRLGTSGLLAVLRGEGGRRARLLAVRAAPLCDRPEELVTRLATVAVGRDPLLAPEAAIALHELLGALRVDALVAREQSLEALEKQAAQLEEVLSEAEALRADIAWLMDMSTARLAEVVAIWKRGS